MTTTEALPEPYGIGGYPYPDTFTKAQLTDYAARVSAAKHAEILRLRAAGAKQTAIIRQAEMLLTRYLTEELSGPTVINDLLGLLDGPAQRAAQDQWDAALKESK